MNLLDNPLPPPDACRQWCNTQPYDLQVLDDAADIDLPWWNEKLKFQHFDLRLRGRDADGRIVTSGRAAVLRSDLRLDSPLIDGDDKTLGLLYLCAAWQGGHRRRHSARRFPRMEIYDLRHDEQHPLDRIRSVLDQCITEQSLPYDTTKGWSGFPETPDVGLGLLAIFMWAVDVRLDSGRAQLIDQNGLSSLTHCGWMEHPALTGYTRRRYNRYLDLLESWSQTVQKPTELVECWLVNRWHARKMEVRSGHSYQPSLF